MALLDYDISTGQYSQKQIEPPDRPASEGEGLG